MRRTVFTVLFIAIFGAAFVTGFAFRLVAKTSKTDPGYHLIDSIQIGGVGRWDYAADDAANVQNFRSYNCGSGK